jgi:1,4-alpha-glucan branching enzyme
LLPWRWWSLILDVAWECPTGGFGGLASVIANLLPALGRFGDVVHVCVRGDKLGFYKYARALVYRALDAITSAEGGIGVGTMLALTAACAEFVANVGQGDVVIGHDVHSTLCVSAGVDRGARGVYIIHMFHGSVVELVVASEVHAVLANSKLTLSQFMEAVKKLRLTVKGKTGVVYFPPPVPVVERRAEFRSEEPLVVVFNRYQANKDPTWFLKILANLAERVRFRVILAGKGMEAVRADYPWLVNKGEVSEAEKRELFSTADLVVQPSLSEPYGLVSLEALALGSPVLVTNKMGVAEVLPPDAVIPVPEHPDDETLITERLAQLLGDPSERRELYEREREAGILRKTWLDTAKEILDYATVA